MQWSVKEERQEGNCGHQQGDGAKTGIHAVTNSDLHQENITQTELFENSTKYATYACFSGRF